MVLPRKRNQDFGQTGIIGGVLPYYGSNDTDQIFDYLSDIDISQPHATTSSSGAPITLYSPADPTNQPKIKTPTRIRSGVLKFRSPEDDFETTIITESTSGSFNLAIPVLTGHDRLLTRDTINSIASIIKAALPASVAYEDEANVFAMSQKLETYSELKAVAEPGNPAAGYIRLFVDTGDNKIKVKRSDGSVVDLESVGPGGGLDERVILKEAGVAVSATSRRINYADASLWDITEDVPNDEFDIDIADGGITNAHLAGGITYAKLSVAGSIINADIHVAAAIAKSKLDLTGAILDADLAGSITNAKLNQITDKAKLHAAILYSDVDNSLGAHFLDITEIAAPASPAANIGRVFFDITDEHLKIKKSAGTVVDLEAAGGGGGTGGGMASGGIISKNGTADEVQFLIPHGLGTTPEIWWVEPASPDAFGHYERDVDATNIIITYAIPPPLGTGNLIYNWAAGFVNAAGGEFTPSSTTTITNKTIGDFLKFTKIAAPASPAAGLISVYADSTSNTIKAKKSDGSVADLETAGGGFSAGGTVQKSGNAVATQFTIAHGLGTTPTIFFALPMSADARGSPDYAADATNITITYPVPPATGTNNLTFVWGAGFVNPALTGFTPTSTDSLLNKTIGDVLDFVQLTSTPTAPAAGKGRLYTKQIDSNNDGLFWQGRKAGAIVEVQIL